MKNYDGNIYIQTGITLKVATPVYFYKYTRK